MCPSAVFNFFSHRLLFSAVYTESNAGESKGTGTAGTHDEDGFPDVDLNELIEDFAGRSVYSCLLSRLCSSSSLITYPFILSSCWFHRSLSVSDSSPIDFNSSSNANDKNNSINPNFMGLSNSSQHSD